MIDENEIETMKRQIMALRKQAKILNDWHDVMHSAWWRRVIWWFMGYRFLSIGTWYDAPWNHWATEKYNDLFSHPDKWVS